VSVTMGKLLRIFSGRLSSWMEFAAGVSIIAVMLLIGCDIVGRIFGCPVPGTYELVSLSGGLIVGLALPATSRSKGHVSTDILTGKLSERCISVLSLTTRLIGIAVFLLAAWGMIFMGVRLKASGETTAVLELPFYPVAYAVGGAFLMQALILFSEIFKAAKQNS